MLLVGSLHLFCSKFHIFSSSERILKIGKCLTKSEPITEWEVFGGHSVLANRANLHPISHRSRYRRAWSNFHTVLLFNAFWGRTAEFGTAKFGVEKEET